MFLTSYSPLLENILSTTLTVFTLSAQFINRTVHCVLFLMCGQVATVGLFSVQCKHCTFAVSHHITQMLVCCVLLIV